MSDDVLFWSRVEHILRVSVEGLSETDRQERIAYCRRTGQHGVRALHDGPDIRFSWGGRLLCVVPRNAFDDEAMFEPLGAVFIPDPPDDPSTLDGDG